MSGSPGGPVLQVLRIRNLAIIESVELELHQGLNVITGETGAGKSILVGALKLVLGGAGAARLVRTGTDAAEVEALFDLSDDPEAVARLEAEDIPVDSGELVVRRVVHASGRTRAYIGGRLATRATLARLAVGLVDISSQHQHHSLVDPRSHLRYLDAFASLGPLRDRFKNAFGTLQDARRAHAGALQALQSKVEREDLLQRQIEEFDSLAPKAGELEALRQELDRLRHGERLQQTTSGAARALYTAERSVCAQVSQGLRPLQDLHGIDTTLDEIAGRLESARLELEEAARDLSAWVSALDLDPSRLQTLEERHHQLKRLARRHGGDLPAALAWRRAAAEELTQLDHAEAEVDRLEGAVAEAKTLVRTLATELTAERSRHAGALATAITDELSTLGMGGARVEVSVAPLGGAGDQSLDGARLTESGVDHVEFLISPNPGEAPRPLAAVASGGELSRSLLALKKVLAGMGPVGLYVFDEVDTGVGGAVAEVIGQKLAEVALHHQVLCITHQPQVTVYGDQHLFVHKVVEDGRTFSRVANLNRDERRDEVARMLGGIEVGEEAKAAAQALLTGARPGK